MESIADDVGLRLSRTLDVLIDAGSAEELRAFLVGLDKPTCVSLLTNFNMGQLRPDVDFTALQLCGGGRRDHAAVLIEFGAPLLGKHNFFQTDAPIDMLELFFEAARSRDCLEEVMLEGFGGVRAGGNIPPSLQTVCNSDSASTLSLLLEAGLDPSIGIGNEPHRMRGMSSLISFAARTGALACLRLLHKRCSPAEWSRLLSPPNGSPFSVSPLASAFSSSRPDVFDFLVAFHRPDDPDGPNLLGADMSPDLMRAGAVRALALHAPDKSLPLEVRVNAAQAAYDSWDERTQLETAIVLRLSSNSPTQLAISVGSHRAVTALARTTATPLFDCLTWAPTEAVTEALLDACAAAEAAQLPSGAAGGVAAVRQQVAARALLPPQAWGFEEIRESACVLLAAAAHEASAEALLTLLQSSRIRSAPILAQRVARAVASAAAGATEVQAASLRAVALARSWALLSPWVAPQAQGGFTLVQTLLDLGADIFASGPQRQSLLCNASIEGWQRAPQLLLTPPPLADPAVVRAIATGEFASADAARAHAAAAAAEEERLFAAVLEDPTALFLLHGNTVWSFWARQLHRVLALRWVWQRMCECDPERARAYLQPSAHGLELQDPLLAAISSRCHRSVRFLTSLGARMMPPAYGYLAKCCFDGSYELAWALFDALPDDAAERARALKAAPKFMESSNVSALSATLLAAARGNRFSQPLAEALFAAGATIPRTLLHLLCDMNAALLLTSRNHNTPLPGELPRSLTWLLEHVHSQGVGRIFATE